MINLLSFFSQKHALSKLSKGAEPPEQLCVDCCVSVRRSSAPCGMTSRKINRSFSASLKASWSTQCPTYRTPSGRGKVWNKLFAGASPRKTVHDVKCLYLTVSFPHLIFCPLSGGRMTTIRSFGPYMKKWKAKSERRGRSGRLRCRCVVLTSTFYAI